jgi:hypothetical protein
MIRFLPDDWLDVVMRPFDMVAPEANSYVEIAAPDVRLAAAVLLAGAVLLLWRRRAGDARPVMRLLALLLVSIGVWLATTGNGRYFIAWLVLLGPLSVGLVRLLPMTAAKRLLLGATLVAAQVFVLTQNPPWGSWSWTTWTDSPYFQVDAPSEPATYVTIASISYSLVALQFPTQSRWISLASGVSPRDAPFVHQLLASSQRLRLLAPAIPGQILPDGKPSAGTIEALGRLLRPQGLLLQPAGCELLRSKGLAGVALRRGAVVNTDKDNQFGFWACALNYRPDAAPTTPDDGDPAVVPVFDAVERMCPRFFPAGGVPMKINGGWVKRYDSDTKLYLLDDGTALYKFWRSVNPTVIGKREQILAGHVEVDCSKIRAPNWRRGGP